MFQGAKIFWIYSHDDMSFYYTTLSRERAECVVYWLNHYNNTKHLYFYVED